MKKFISILLAGMMVISIAGCSNDTKETDTSNASETESQTEESNSTPAETETPEETNAPEEEADNTSESDGDTVSISHSLGDMEVKKNPSKIVVFDFGMLDTIDALNIDAEIALPKSNVPSYLEKFAADEYTSAGDIKEPDLEAINAFAPELIIISGRQTDYYADLSEIAPTLYVEIDSTKYMEDFKKNNGYIGEIFDKTAEVEEQISGIETTIETTKTNAESAGLSALIILTNDGSISAYGPGSRFGIIHDVFGIPAKDTGIEVSTHGQEVNYEYISEQNPDLLFVVDRTTVVGGENTAEKTLDNELVNETNAVKNDKVVSLNPDVWYLSGGGLASVSMMAEEINQVFE